MGYSEKLKKTVDIKSMADSNSIYFQRHVFTNEDSLGLSLLGSNTGCTSVTKEQLKQQNYLEIVALLDSLRVDIKNMTACLRDDVGSIIILTWSIKSDCGKCLDDVSNAGDSIKRVLQAKLI